MSPRRNWDVTVWRRRYGYPAIIFPPTVNHSSLAGAAPPWLETWWPRVVASDLALIPTNALDAGDRDGEWVALLEVGGPDARRRIHPTSMGTHRGAWGR